MGKKKEPRKPHQNRYLAEAKGGQLARKAALDNRAPPLYALGEQARQQRLEEAENARRSGKSRLEPKVKKHSQKLQNQWARTRQVKNKNDADRAQRQSASDQRAAAEQLSRAQKLADLKREVARLHERLNSFSPIVWNSKADAEWEARRLAYEKKQAELNSFLCGN